MQKTRIFFINFKDKTIIFYAAKNIEITNSRITEIDICKNLTNKYVTPINFDIFFNIRFKQFTNQILKYSMNKLLVIMIDDLVDPI